MFLGHYAVGLAAKKAAPHLSLGTLFFATQFLDLIWPIFLLLGLEHVRIHPGLTAFTPLDFYDYPLSHSLLVVLGWATLLGCIHYLFRQRILDALMIALGVGSHWVLDLITHRPDLPLAPGSKTLVGLGLWNSVFWSVLVEGLLFIVGVILYVRATRAVDKTGRWAFYVLIGFLALIWMANIFSPPPPNVQVIAFSGLGLWLFIPWACWVDRHRKFVGRL